MGLERRAAVQQGPGGVHGHVRRVDVRNLSQRTGIRVQTLQQEREERKLEKRQQEKLGVRLVVEKGGGRRKGERRFCPCAAGGVCADRKHTEIRQIHFQEVEER